MDHRQIAAGRSIQKATGKTFYLATRLLPKRVRYPTYVLYGFFRIADEVVDDPGDLSPTAQRAELERIRDAALGNRPTDDPVLDAFQTVQARYDIPDAEVNAFLGAMKRDVSTDRYRTAAELDDYMRGSAAAVGAMMTAIMEPEDPETALPHARRLGEAFQLTNFIRDVREDVRDLERIYLPLATFTAHGCSPETVERLECTPAFRATIAAELRRAESRYRKGVAGIRYLPEDCQFPVLLAAVLYAEHHRLIRAQDYDVLSQRPSLTRWHKLRCLGRTWWHWRLNRDPEIVFQRAGAIPVDEPEPQPGHGRELPSR